MSVEEEIRELKHTQRLLLREWKSDIRKFLNMNMRVYYDPIVPTAGLKLMCNLHYCGHYTMDEIGAIFVCLLVMNCTGLITAVPRSNILPMEVVAS